MEAFAQSDVCAVVVTYFPEAGCADNLAPIAAQVGRLVVVDNGSSATSLEPVETEARRLGATVIHLDVNMGIARALNVGLELAAREGFRWLATFDQDSRAPPDMVATMFRALAVYPESERVIVIAPLHVDRRLNVRIGERRFEGSGEGWRLVRSAMTSGNLVNVHIAQSIGGYDDSLFIDYVDHEFCLRARRQGYRVLEATSAILGHSLGRLELRQLGPWQIKVTNYAPVRRYYMNRNRILVWRKYWAREPTWVVWDSMRMLIELLSVVLYERDVRPKTRMVARGVLDAGRNVRGEFRPS